MGNAHSSNLLDIPDVPITKICSYLSLEETKEFSTMCKQLRRSGLPSLLNASFISFKSRSEIPDIIAFIKENVEKGKALFNLFIKSESLDNSPESNADLLNLFRECGDHIKHLKLSYGCCSLKKEVGNGLRDNNSIPIFPSGNELFPNLKKFDLVYHNHDGQRVSEEEDERDYRDDQTLASLPFIEGVLRNSPKLKEMMVEFAEYEVPFQFRLFELIGGLRIDTLEIRFLDFSDEFELTHLQSLHLRKLVILDVGMDPPESLILTNFLETQRKYLKYFHLETNLAEGLPHFTFPRMEALQTFRLGSWGGITNAGNLPPISFSQLPKLNELDLGVCEKDLPTLFPTDGEPITSVKILKLAIEQVGEPYFRSALVFKFLSKLEIPVASYLNNFWKDLPRLEELTLHTHENNNLWEEGPWLDQVITGLTISQRYWKPITDQDIRRYAQEYEEMETKKSLALLTGLRLLRLLHGSMQDQRMMLSDISCRLVLIKMGSLKCIDFCGIHPSFVGASRNVLREMGDRMTLCFGEVRDWYY